MFCAQAFLHVSPDKRIAIEEYGWLDWLNIFWADKGGMPASYQFWFVRDLMVAVLLSPVLYLIVKHLKAFGVFRLRVLWLFGIWFHVTGFNIDAFFLFRLRGVVQHEQMRLYRRFSAGCALERRAPTSYCSWLTRGCGTLT